MSTHTVNSSPEKEGLLSKAEQAAVREKKETNFQQIMKRLLKNKLAVTGGIIFLILCLLAIFAPIVAPYDYFSAVGAKNLGPSLQHLFGTDQYGRDVFSRILYGGRWSLSLGLASTALSTFLGIVVGAVAGYFGGKVDMVIMRITDVVQCIPGMLLTICLCMILGKGSIISTIIAMSFGGIWGTARMLRGQILMVRESEYVEAAKATNVSSFRTIVKYVLPNSIQQTIIGACMSIGGSISAISGLSFLGLGIQPPYPEWGAMLSDGRAVMRYYPNLLVAPCIMIALTILSISLFGDGLRDAMDPRLKD